jgi:uncharacterized membrane protein (UPF0127 family)
LVSNDQALGCSIGVAGGFLARLIGWMGLRSAPASLLLIPGCRAVHTCFMRFPIDLIFIDADARVVGLVRGLKPWRLAACRVASSVLEAPVGWIDRSGLACGDRISNIDPFGRALEDKENDQ